jgi:hypothetical protein
MQVKGVKDLGSVPLLKTNIASDFLDEMLGSLNVDDAGDEEDKK